MLLIGLAAATAAVAFVPIVLYIAFVLLYGVYIHWKMRVVGKGPPSNLVFGNLLEAQTQKQDVYLVAHGHVSKYGKMFPFWLGQRCVIWTSDFKLVQQIGIKRFAVFTERPLMSTLNMPSKVLTSVSKELIFARNPLWSSLRAALQPLFHTSSIKSYSPFINEAAVKLREYLLQHAGPHDAKQTAPKPASIDVWRPFGSLTLDVIGRASLGCDLGALDSLKASNGKPPYIVQAAEDIFGASDLVLPAMITQLLGPFGFLESLWNWVAVNLMDYQHIRRALAGRGRMFDVGRCMYRNALQRTSGGVDIAESSDWIFWDAELVKDNPYKDIVPAEGSLPDMLAKARSKADARGLTEMEIVANIYEMLGAGYETTANTMAFTIYLISMHKRVEAKLLQEIDAFGRHRDVTLADLDSLPYLDAVIREALRIYPVAPFVLREAAEDVVIDGKFFPKGSAIALALYSMLNDPEVFPEPDVFKPERWLTDDPTIKAMSGLAFGIGPRNCIGYKLAMHETKITLLRLYQVMTFDVDTDLHKKGLRTAHKVTIQPVDGVHCHVHRRPPIPEQ